MIVGGRVARMCARKRETQKLGQRGGTLAGCFVFVWVGFAWFDWVLVGFDASFDLIGFGCFFLLAVDSGSACVCVCVLWLPW